MEKIRQANVTYWYMLRGVVIAKIVCNHPEDFETIRSEYFPKLPAKQWVKLGEKK